MIMSGRFAVAQLRLAFSISGNRRVRQTKHKRGSDSRKPASGLLAMSASSKASNQQLQRATFEKAHAIPQTHSSPDLLKPRNIAHRHADT